MTNFAIMNKMAALVLTYELGLPSYDDSKLEKWKILKDCLTILEPHLW